MSRKPLNSRVSGTSSNSLNFYSSKVPKASSFTKTKAHNDGNSASSAHKASVDVVPRPYVDQPKQPIPDYCSNAKPKLVPTVAAGVEAKKGGPKKRTGPKKRPSLSEQLASIGNSVADLTGETLHD